MSKQLQRALRELRIAQCRPAGCQTPHESYLAGLRLQRPSYPYSTSTPKLNPPTPAQSSVDASEVSHFDALASSWWDPHGPSRLLHLMNPLRHDFIARCRSSQNNSATTLPYTPEPDAGRETGLTYLDIGCGGGIFAESAARLHHTSAVTAIDPSTEVLAVARRHARRDPLLQQPGKLTYLNTSIEGLSSALPAAGGSSASQDRRFDVVSVFEVIEHVRDPSPFLLSVLPFVRPGGWLVGSTIARTWASWLTTKVVAEDLVGIVPRGTHDWDKYINPKELRDWFGKREGWEEWRVMEVAYVPGFGWKEVRGVEGLGNYFFGVRRAG